MKIRPLEKNDLEDLHRLNNMRSIMSYWFEEPYTSYSELLMLYEKHLGDESERRFVIDVEGKFAGIVELVEISSQHRNCEIQIALFPEFEGFGHAQFAMEKGIEYGFNFLNLFKIYLYVDRDNDAAVHIYEKLGFKVEGELLKQFFSNGEYKDSYFMGLLKDQYLESKSLDNK